ncbi:Na+/H+ antiporter subunit D [Sporosarcina trichiuri]|uniref:Na+/H+ antiporter subunit D n=1 Tax=Sporosarcina trichiuri TaxID=3056445 RepID=UPI0025B492E6|nr:Na+/H+ antiporter subunit D [Sporosarcina sp. 0.2-SM1T-5]WJY27142.1 Na+/H+ antiporter subunit D [Sporosarcina sp. 0.2-SM1T-5]
MTNELVLPVLIPLLAAVILTFFRESLSVQRLLSFLAAAGSAAVGSHLLLRVRTEGIVRLDFGGWDPPYGISFVGDSFALLLVSAAGTVTSLILLYAFSTIGEAFEKMYVYPLMLFLLAGVNGSFLTGDIFNLFVCFEVMLLASYALLVLGGRKVQLVEAFTYITINVLASWFFLLAIAYLYGAAGTLNMAHLAVRAAESGQDPILTVIGLIFLLVFSLKAGLLLYFWLPGSYGAPPAAIAALFGALLTKVGIYAMIRLFTLVFNQAPGIIGPLIGGMAALTLIGGSIGALSSRDIRQIISYNVVIAVGFILTGLAAGSETALQGSIYYVLHDMVVKAMLFLAGGLMITLTGRTRIGEMSGLLRNYPKLGWLFFIAMLSLTGIPPFSGFIGKVLLGEGLIGAELYLLLALAFLSSLFVLYSLLRIFLNCFMGESIIGEEEQVPLKKRTLLPIAALGVLTFAIGIGADWLAPFVNDAAAVLTHPDSYVEAVLGNDAQPGR